MLKHNILFFWWEAPKCKHSRACAIDANPILCLFCARRLLRLVFFILELTRANTILALEGRFLFVHLFCKRISLAYSRCFEEKCFEEKYRKHSSGSTGHRIFKKSGENFANYVNWRAKMQVSERLYDWREYSFELVLKVPSKQALFSSMSRTCKWDFCSKWHILTLDLAPGKSFPRALHSKLSLPAMFSYVKSKGETIF